MICSNESVIKLNVSGKVDTHMMVNMHNQANQLRNDLALRTVSVAYKR